MVFMSDDQYKKKNKWNTALGALLATDPKRNQGMDNVQKSINTPMQSVSQSMQNSKYQKWATYDLSRNQQTGWLNATKQVSFWEWLVKDLWYNSLDEYTQQTWQNLDFLEWLAQTNKQLTWDTNFANTAWTQIAWAFSDFSRAKNQAEAWIAAYWTKVTNWQQLQWEIEQINTLINKWVTDASQIWQALGMNPKKVNDLLMGDYSKYLTLSDEAVQDATEGIQAQLDYQTEKYEMDKQQWVEELTRLQEDYDKLYQEQVAKNEIQDANLSLLARMTWTWFSSRGIMWMEELQRQWQQMLSKLTTSYERSSADMQVYMKRLANAYTYNSWQITRSLNDAIDASKQAYMWAIQSIKTQLWEKGQETQEAVRMALVNFGQDVENYYKTAQDQMKQNREMAQQQYDNIVENEKITYQRQQDTITEMKEASFALTPQEILSNPSLTPEQKSIAMQQQQASAINTLNELSVTWVALPEDVERLKAFMEQGTISPQMAISTIAGGNPNQYDANAEKPMTPLQQAQLDEQLLKNQQLKDEIAKEQLDWVTDPIERANIIAAQRASLTEDWKLKIPQGTRWYQCWEFVNDSLWTRVFGDSFKQKASKVNSYVPIVGGAIVMDRWNQYGHVWLVKSWNMEEWTVTVMHTNYNSSWELTTDTFPLDDPQIAWYYSPDAKEKLTDFDINKFNEPTFKPQKDIESDSERQKYELYLDEKKRIFSDPEADIKEIIDFSRWMKELSDTETLRLDKFDTALSQLDAIEKQVSDMSTWPVIWKLREMNPYDTDAQVLKAQLQALIPNLARGIYGEVGVLTDNDIRNYAKTIPNLTQTSDVQDAILAMTLDIIAWGYKRQLQNLAASNNDVSGFAWKYEEIKWLSDSIKQRIWVWEQEESDEVKSYLDSVLGE